MALPSSRRLPHLPYHHRGVHRRRRRHAVRQSAECRNGRHRSAKVVYVDSEYVAAPMHRLSKKLRGGDNVAWQLNVAMTYPSYIALSSAKSGRDFVVSCVRANSISSIASRRCRRRCRAPLAAWSPVPFVLGRLNGGLPGPRRIWANKARTRVDEQVSLGLSIASLLSINVCAIGGNPCGVQAHDRRNAQKLAKPRDRLPRSRLRPGHVPPTAGTLRNGARDVRICRPARAAQVRRCLDRGVCSCAGVAVASIAGRWRWSGKATPGTVDSRAQSRRASGVGWMEIAGRRRG